MFRTFFSCLGILFFTVLPLGAAISLPTLLTEHMVLQQGFPLHFWGKALPGESVTVSFQGENRTVVADGLGRWSCHMKPAEPGGPHMLTFKGGNIIEYRDIWVGDVWIAAGQSNMEFQLKNAEGAKEEISAACSPQIRFLKVDHNTALYPLDRISTKGWIPVTSESVADASAVSYYFGKQIHQSRKIPIGLIDASWGGTPVASFTPLDAISRDAALMPLFSHWSKMADQQTEILLQIETENTELDAAEARAKAEGKAPPARPWHPDFAAWAPAAIYNGMIAPLTPFPIRGVIWYQGESDTSGERAALYGRLFQTMIQSWRNTWGVGDFPFLFVQIANWIAGPENAWPELREAQRKSLSLVNTGMAVTIDVGNPTDIHPRDKKSVGLRLALAAQALAYGEKHEYSGPLYRQTTVEGQELRVWFDHAQGGLVTKGREPVKGFEIAGADGKFVKAEARIQGATVLASNPAVPTPFYVRYGWADNPEVSLYNQTGLPASPFNSKE
jgi:sialate O-acetylesterase